MENWTCHTFSGDLDLQQMVNLIRISRSAPQLSDYPRIVDLYELMNVPEIRLRTCLWQTVQGELLAYAIADTWNNLWFDVLPEGLGTPIETEVVQWGVSCLRSQAREENKPAEMTLDTNCSSDNWGRIAMLQRQGFAEKPLRTLQLVRSLKDQFAYPKLPSGFTLRTVHGEFEADALAKLHCAAFGTDEMTAEYRAFMMQVPGYDPDLDLLAVAPNGKLAAFCVCQVDPASEGKEGFTDPIGTFPDYQRQGLARSLLLEGLRRLKSRGVEVVRLSTTSENLAMLKTAESVGFNVERTKLWFSKPIPPIVPGESTDE